MSPDQQLNHIYYFHQMRYTQFFTATILNWQKLLLPDTFKDIIISALKHRVEKKQVRIYGLVIMPNHIHLLWYIHPDIKREDFQRDLLKYTAREMIHTLKADGRDDIIQKHAVNDKDRKIQIWERNSLTTDIYSLEVFNQKLDYIHANPLQDRWQLAKETTGYKYSSAIFYETGVDEFNMLTNYLEDY